MIRSIDSTLTVQQPEEDTTESNSVEQEHLLDALENTLKMLGLLTSMLREGINGHGCEKEPIDKTGRQK